MTGTADALLATVHAAATAFAPFTARDDAVRRVPAPGKWSAAQILGHLIDSAANNHHRFVRARWQDDLVFAGYEQERWVEAQAYAAAPWPDLVELWAAYNRHLARLIAGTPTEVRARRHLRHNLHQIAWQPIGDGDAATLDWFFADYVGHLRHHLRQIDALLGTRTGGS